MTTRTLTVTLKDLLEVVGAGYTVEIEATADDHTSGYSVVKSTATAVADGSGVATFDLVPNTLGNQNALYTARVSDLSGALVLSKQFQMPDANSELNDLVSATTVETPGAAEGFANQAQASAIAAAADLVLTNADVVLTHADVVLTNADVVLTNADVILTAADAASTAADVLITNDDVILTNADAASTAANVITTNADAATTTADVITTNADVVLTAADAASTAADVVTTTADVILTGADAASTAANVITTNADVVLTNADAASTAADVLVTNADVVLTNADVVTTATAAAQAATSAANAAAVVNWSIPGFTTTLAMTDGVVARMYPASEPGVPDAWRFNKGASWYNETRTTGAYLGEFANVTAAAGATDAAIGDYYYDSALAFFYELSNIGTPASDATERAGSAEFPSAIEFVVKANNIFILDLKDGSLWKRIRASAGPTSALSWWKGSRGVSSLDYKNGVLVFGKDSGTTPLGLNIVNFLEDKIYKIESTEGNTGELPMSAIGQAVDILPTSRYETILANTVKAVAIGDASKHYGYDEWGVPKQFIAVGCETTHGISVIHPNGKVYDITGQSSLINAVEFNAFGELVATGLFSSYQSTYNVPFRDIDYSEHVRVMYPTASISADAASFPRTLIVGTPTATALMGQKALVADDTFLAAIDEDVYGTGNDDGRDSPATYVGYDSALTEHFVHQWLIGW